MTVSAPTVHFAIDHARIRPEDRHPGSHQLPGRVHAHGLVEMHHLGNGVRAQHLVHAFRLHGDDALAVGNQHGRDVGQVVLAMRVVGGKGIELAKQRRGAKAIDPELISGASFCSGRSDFCSTMATTSAPSGERRSTRP